MINHLDHLVLTTAHDSECVDFYTRVLGMKLESFIGGTPPVERKAFKFAVGASLLTRVPSQSKMIALIFLRFIR